MGATRTPARKLGFFERLLWLLNPRYYDDKEHKRDWAWITSITVILACPTLMWLERGHPDTIFAITMNVLIVFMSYLVTAAFLVTVLRQPWMFFNKLTVILFMISLFGYIVTNQMPVIVEAIHRMCRWSVK